MLNHPCVSAGMSGFLDPSEAVGQLVEDDGVSYAVDVGVFEGRLRSEG